MASFASIAASGAALGSGKPTTSPTNTSPHGATGPATLRALVDALSADAQNIHRAASECVDAVLNAERKGVDGVPLQPTDRVDSNAQPSPTSEDRFAGMKPKRGGSGAAVTTTSSAQGATAPHKGDRESATAAPSKKCARVEECVAALQRILETLPAPGTLAGGSSEAAQLLERICCVLRGIILSLATSTESSLHVGSSVGSAPGPRRAGSSREGPFRRLTTTTAWTTANAAAPVLGNAGKDNPDQNLQHSRGSSSSAVPNLLSVVAAAAAKLSTVGADATTTPRNLAAASRLNPTARSVEQETRALSLFCLSAAAQAQPEAVPLAFPVLFPDIVSLQQLWSNTWKHPLLSPFLHDRVYRCRAAAGAAIGQLLQRCALYLQVAVEPSPKDRQSFTSIPTGLGRTLRDLHNVALHGLTATATATGGTANPAAPAGAQHHYHHHHDRPLFLHLFSALLSVTPYPRCPESRQCVTQKVLSLPLLQDLVGTAPSAASASRSDASDFSAAAQLLGNIWRTKSLRADVQVHVRSSAGRQLVNHLVAALPAFDASRALLHLVRSFPDALTPSQIDLMIRAGEALLARDTAAGSNSDGAAPQSKFVVDVVEMLRTLMHACGLAWDAFDATQGDDAEDMDDRSAAAASAEGTPPPKTKKAPRGAPSSAPTAGSSVNVQQKLDIVRRLYLTTLLHRSPAVRVATYKCMAQLGNDVLSLLEPLPTGFGECLNVSTSALPPLHADPTSDCTSPSPPLSGKERCEAPLSLSPSLTQLTEWIIRRGATDMDASVRAEAVLCVGAWAMSAPCCIPLHPAFLRVGMALIANERESEEVRAKAAFLLSNLAAQLHAVQSAVDSDRFLPYVVRACDACAVSMTAAARTRSGAGSSSGTKSLASVLAGHAVRMIPFLLGALEDDASLIMELEGHPEGVTNLFLERLAGYASLGGAAMNSAGNAAPLGAARPPARALAAWDAKTRWNAAVAIGEVVSLTRVYAADPPAARLCVESLIGVLRGDSNYKVLTLAMGALVKIFRAAPASWTDFFGDALDGAASALARICTPPSSSSSATPDEGTSQPAVLSKQEADLRAALLAEILAGVPVLLACAPGTQRVQRAIARNREVLAAHNLV